MRVTRGRPARLKKSDGCSSAWRAIKKCDTSSSPASPRAAKAIAMASPKPSKPAANKGLAARDRSAGAMVRECSQWPPGREVDAARCDKLSENEGHRRGRYEFLHYPTGRVR